MTEVRKLYRSKDDRIIAGVCGGLADYLAIDPVIIRLAFIALTMLNGFGLLLYVIMAIIVPSENTPHAHPRDNLNEFAEAIQHNAENIKDKLKTNHYYSDDDNPKSRFKFWLGIFICFIGIIYLIKNFLPIPFIFFSEKIFWPMVVLFFGVYLITKK